MASIYSVYPNGAAGFALVMLRCSTALMLVGILSEIHVIPLVIKLLIDVLIVSIVLGVMTRLSALVSAVPSAILLTQLDRAPPLLMVTHVLDVVALSILGPGVWSIDSVLFGRRKIRLPD